MITTMTPTSENIRGTSALPYHLIKGRSGTSYENEMLTLRNADATKKNTSETSYDNNNNIGNVEKYERMAAEGQRQVLKWHDRARIASQLFNIETT